AFTIVPRFLNFSQRLSSVRSAVTFFQSDRGQPDIRQVAGLWGLEYPSRCLQRQTTRIMASCGFYGKVVDVPRRTINKRLATSWEMSFGSTHRTRRVKTGLKRSLRLTQNSSTRNHPLIQATLDSVKLPAR